MNHTDEKVRAQVKALKAKKKKMDEEAYLNPELSDKHNEEGKKVSKCSAIPVHCLASPCLARTVSMR